MITWVICCGMRRSASTLQYQIVDEILKLKKLGFGIGYFEPGQICSEFSKIDSVQFVAAKTHDYFNEAKELNESGKLKVIFSYRDIRDIIVSSMYKWYNGKFENTYNENYISILKKSYSNWITLNDIYKNSYEEIIANLELEVSSIASYLKIKLTNSEIKRIANDLNLESQKKRIMNMNFSKEGVKTKFGTYDPLTQLHSNHIRSGKQQQWKIDLSNYQVALIQRDWKEWLLENKYTIHPTIYNSRFILNIKLISIKIKSKIKKYLFPIFSDTLIYKYYRNYKYRLNMSSKKKKKR